MMNALAWLKANDPGDGVFRVMVGFSQGGRTMQVKGTWLLDFVKMIRSNKDKNFDQWLTRADWDIINSQVLPSQWYPYESFNRIGRAVFRGVSGSNLEITKAFGKLMMKNLLDVYKSVLIEGDPAESVEKFNVLRRTFFKDIESDIMPTSKEDKRMKMKLIIVEIDRQVGEPEAFAHLLSGALEELTVRAGAHSADCGVDEIEEGYELTLTWE
jgi:hypothetical protein